MASFSEPLFNKGFLPSAALNFVYSGRASWFLSNQDDVWLSIYVQHLSDSLVSLKPLHIIP